MNTLIEPEDLFYEKPVSTHTEIALQSAIEAKDAEIERLKADYIEMEKLCDATYVAKGADAYHHACSEMERFQEERREAGKEVGTERSLCDGMAWLYGHVAKVEAERNALQAKLDALQKQEPVGWLHFDASEDRSGKFPWMLMVNQDHQTIAAKTKKIDIYAAPVVAPAQELTTCNCRWDGETQVQQCTLHAAHVDAIHEWAERAKTAEQKLAAPVVAERKPLTRKQIDDLAEEGIFLGNVYEITAEIERAHGIGGQP